jgi:hypothetical protein
MPLRRRLGIIFARLLGIILDRHLLPNGAIACISLHQNRGADCGAIRGYSRACAR